MPSAPDDDRDTTRNSQIINITNCLAVPMTMQMTADEVIE